MSIQLKRGLTSNINNSYVLKQGQIGVEMPGSTNVLGAAYRFKIGDGASKWSDLPYAGVSDHMQIGDIKFDYDSSSKVLTIS